MIHLSCVTWNRLELTRRCLESLFAHTDGEYTLTIVDNGSTDGTRQYLEALASGRGHVSCKFLDRNMGVAVASNLAWDDNRQAEIYVKIDNDLDFLHSAWLSRLVEILQTRPHVGMAAYRLCDWHNLSHKTIPLSDGGYAEETSVCGGGCAAIPYAAYAQLGFWNEGFGRYGHEDQEYSCRVKKAGLALASLAPDGVLVHRGYDAGKVDTAIERDKDQSHNARLSGETAYYCYTLLYDEGLLPLNLPRKYLPRQENGHYRFDFNPAFRPVQKLLQEMTRSLTIDTTNGQPRVDLSTLRLRNAISQS